MIARAGASCLRASSLFMRSVRLCSASTAAGAPSHSPAASALSHSTATSASHSTAADDSLEPVELATNPYEKEKPKCLMCRHGMEFDYKNARLLQQFVSTFSGRVYDRHITGLCDRQQKALLEAVAASRRAGLMPVLVKDPRYVRDPRLFDPLRPVRPHSYA